MQLKFFSDWQIFCSKAKGFINYKYSKYIALKFEE